MRSALFAIGCHQTFFEDRDLHHHFQSRAHRQIATAQYTFGHSTRQAYTKLQQLTIHQHVGNDHHHQTSEHNRQANHSQGDRRSTLRRSEAYPDYLSCLKQPPKSEHLQHSVHRILLLTPVWRMTGGDGASSTPTLRRGPRLPRPARRAEPPPRRQSRQDDPQFCF